MLASLLFRNNHVTTNKLRAGSFLDVSGGTFTVDIALRAGSGGLKGWGGWGVLGWGVINDKSR